MKKVYRHLRKYENNLYIERTKTTHNKREEKYSIKKYEIVESKYIIFPCYLVKNNNPQNIPTNKEANKAIINIPSEPRTHDCTVLDKLTNVDVQFKIIGIIVFNHHLYHLPQINHHHQTHLLRQKHHR